MFSDTCFANYIHVRTKKTKCNFKIDRTMNYFLLAETDFFRLINEAGDCNMETAYTAFATQVIELCNGGMDMNLTVIALDRKSVV